jgi:predicted MFS family arabinose efflux permease
VGVIASGLLTDGPGWRWIFFINVPIGVLLIALAARFLPADRVDTGARRYDVFGASTVTSGLLLLVYGLSRGVEHGWGSPTTLALFVGAAALLMTFTQVEARSQAPLVPGAALRNRTMVAADLAALLLFGAFFSFIFLGTLLMQQLLGYSPTRTGLAWLATSLSGFVAAGLAGRLASAVGIRPLLVVGMALLAAGAAWLMRVPPGAEYGTDLFPAFLLAGIGIGLCAPTVQIGALSGVAEPEVGLASGLVETMREIGGAIGIAAVSTVLIAQTRGLSESAGPLAQEQAAFEGFQAAFVVIVIVAGLGALVSSIAFPRAARDAEAVQPRATRRSGAELQ